MPLRRITPADALLLRDVRLRALASDPLAFGSTYALEAPRDLSAWDTWAREHASGADKATFFALRDATAEVVGLAVGKRSQQPRRFDLFSMWVDRAERRRGIARELVDVVAAWVAASGGTHLSLWVTQAGARIFYDRCGFVDDGRREPLAHSPEVIETGMTREL
jgi:GNAT superfamily N-acetyltransferase